MADQLGLLRQKSDQGNQRHRVSDTYTARAIDNNDFTGYQIGIIHDWLQTITALAFVLVPLFFVLDIFITPRELLPRFAVYRGISALIAFLQYLVVRNSKPNKYSYLHGYLMSLQVGGAIVLMTVDLGGFESGYYAGLIMVIIGVNLLMPWRATHTAANSALIIGMYVIFNLIAHPHFNGAAMANNLFFLCGNSIISVAINHVRYRLIQTEFSLLVQVKQARDALWSEMELAKHIQMALLPRHLQIKGYEIAVTMIPAMEVGGDYYDIIETVNGERYVAIGDVAGHGLDSGLIMMMAQTSVMTVIKGRRVSKPVEVLDTVNNVLRENVGRLGSNHYMTMSILKLGDRGLTVSGHHQDILIYRAAEKRIEVVQTEGSWLGITDSLSEYLSTKEIPISNDDVVLLFTDGLTESRDENEDLYGQDRLEEVFARVAHSPVPAAAATILEDVQNFQHTQTDDMTLMILRKVGDGKHGRTKKG